MKRNFQFYLGWFLLFFGFVFCKQHPLLFFFFNKRKREKYASSNAYKDSFIKILTNPMPHKADIYFQEGHYQGLV